MQRIMCYALPGSLYEGCSHFPEWTLSLLAGQATSVCHDHDVVTAEQTRCVPSDLITEGSLDD